MTTTLNTPHMPSFLVRWKKSEPELEARFDKAVANLKTDKSEVTRESMRMLVEYHERFPKLDFHALIGKMREGLKK